MKWSDLHFAPSTRILRQFAGAWLVFFLAWAAILGLGRGHHGLGLTLAGIAVAVGGLGLFRPPAVRGLYIACMVLAFPIGWLVSNLVLGLLFYGVFAPVALFFRLKGRDPLRLRRTLEQPSYWTPKKLPQDVRRYFRQF